MKLLNSNCKKIINKSCGSYFLSKPKKKTTKKCLVKGPIYISASYIVLESKTLLSECHCWFLKRYIIFFFYLIFIFSLCSSEQLLSTLLYFALCAMLFKLYEPLKEARRRRHRFFNCTAFVCWQNRLRLWNILFLNKLFGWQR